MKKFLLFAAMAACSLGISAQEVQSTTQDASADTWLRKGNTAKHGSDKVLEIYSFKSDTESAEFELDFVGVMAFDVPSAPDEDWVMQSATLRLVTERAKGNLVIYPFVSFGEDNIYADLADEVAAARQQTPIVESFKLAGQNGKAVTDNGVTMNTVAEWTNTLDLTAYLKSGEINELSMLLVNPANTKTSVKVYTREATDVELKDGTIFAAKDLVPQLTVVYEKPLADGVQTLTLQSTGRGEVYTLGGQRMAQPTKGIYVVNGKKIVIK